MDYPKNESENERDIRINEFWQKKLDEKKRVKDFIPSAFFERASEEETAAGKPLDFPNGLKKNNENKILAHDELLELLLQEIKTVDFYEKSNLQSGEKLTRAHYTIIAIEEILDIAKQKQWSLCVSDGSVYLYNGAFWKL